MKKFVISANYVPPANIRKMNQEELRKEIKRFEESYEEAIKQTRDRLTGALKGDWTTRAALALREYVKILKQLHQSIAGEKSK